MIKVYSLLPCCVLLLHGCGPDSGPASSGPASTSLHARLAGQAIPRRLVCAPGADAL